MKIYKLEVYNFYIIKYNFLELFNYQNILLKPII
jgi:hypothetical protein